MKFKNKKVLVYGLGGSGRAAIELLKNVGAEVSFYDDNTEFSAYVGFERNPFEKQYDAIVVSPGVVEKENKLIEQQKKNGAKVLSEIDLAFLNCKGRVIGVTGTNGKTTTCLLTYQFLKKAGFEAFLCGNVGLPFSSVALKTKKESVVVCEISSFQLESSRFFHPEIACILNVKPDHLDRHGSFEEYKKTKEKIAESKKTLLILNLDDEEAKKMGDGKNTEYFSKAQMRRGANVKNGFVCLGRKKLFAVSDVLLKGEKNVENVLASVAICSHFKVDKECFADVVKTFKTASHRIEEVGVVDGVTYVDDSKATNVASTVACLEAFEDKKIVLMLGGKGKDISYDELFDGRFKIKNVICFGEERDKIDQSAKRFGFKTLVAPNLKTATLLARQNASEGDFVLLSPACSSLDEFDSYKERGDRFKQYVLEFLNDNSRE